MRSTRKMAEEPEDAGGTSRRGRRTAPDTGGHTLAGGRKGDFGEEPGEAASRHLLRPRDEVLEEEQIRQLLRSFANGSAEAFWSLWDLYKGHLYCLCLWQMGGVREEAEEALSRAMLRALNKLPSNGHQILNLRAWLSKLTLNLCVDLHRERSRQVRRLESIENVLLGAGNLALTATDSPEEDYLNREVFAYLCRAVNDLPPRLREPFVLRFFQEMAYCDIAECLILSTENVRKRIQQARDILRERLEWTYPVGRRAGRRNGGAAKRSAPPINVVNEAVETSAVAPPRPLRAY